MPYLLVITDADTDSLRHQHPIAGPEAVAIQLVIFLAEQMQQDWHLRLVEAETGKVVLSLESSFRVAEQVYGDILDAAQGLTQEERNPSQVANDTMLEAAVNAAMSGHDLTSFYPVSKGEELTGYEARCEQCGQTVWVGREGLQYSLLGEACGEKE